MAILWVQQTGSGTSGGTSFTAAFGSNTTTSNALIAMINVSLNPGSANLIKSVSDGTNNFVPIFNSNAVGGSAEYFQTWANFNITGLTTPTITVTTNISVSSLKMSIIEVSGLAKIQPVDYVTVAFNKARTGGLLGVDTQNTKKPNNFVMMFAQIYSGLTVTYTAGSGFSNVASFGTNLTGGTAGVESRVASVQAPLSSTISHASNTDSGVMLGVFSDTDLPPYNQDVFMGVNNYQFLKVGDGMSVGGDKIR